MWLTLSVGLLVLALMMPVQAQTGRTIAVAQFENISVDSGMISSATLSNLLGQLLQQSGQVRVVTGPAMRDALRTRGYTLEDLISPSKAAEVAQAVGADWVVTGRWTQLRFISRATPEPPSSMRHGDALAIADVEIRVLEASTRRRVFEGRFSGRMVGGDFGALYLAATEALRGAAAAIARL